MHLYLDIETIPGQRPGLRDEIAAKITPPGNYKKADTIAAWEADEKPALVEEAFRKTSFDGGVGHVVSIAYAIDDGEVDGIGPGMADRHWCAVPWQDGSAWKPDYSNWESIEAERLEMTFRAMTRALQAAANAAMKHPFGPGRGYVTRQADGSLVDCDALIGPVTVVAHHADFDIRFLFHRAVVLGVRLPWWFPVNARPNHFFNGAPAVFDTMTYWAGYGGRIGQDRLCAALGIERGDDIPGSEVYDRWLAGDGEAIWNHNKADVERLRAIHRRLTFWKPPEPAPTASELDSLISEIPLRPLDSLEGQADV